MREVQYLARLELVTGTAVIFSNTKNLYRIGTATSATPMLASLSSWEWFRRVSPPP